ncbi:MAG TPA: hypothetical protein V6D20_02400 [Candidatus Obscuribacterales bacterium]
MSELSIGVFPEIPEISASQWRGNFNSSWTRWSAAWFDHFVQWNGDIARGFAPVAAGTEEYSADIMSRFLGDLLTAMDTTPKTDPWKLRSIYALAQRGQDIYHTFRLGCRWTGGAGQSQGRKEPFALYGALRGGSILDFVRTLQDEMDWTETRQVHTNPYGFGSGVPLWGDLADFTNASMPDGVGSETNGYWGALLGAKNWNGSEAWNCTGGPDNKYTL